MVNKVKRVHVKEEAKFTIANKEGTYPLLHASLIPNLMAIILPLGSFKMRFIDTILGVNTSLWNPLKLNPTRVQDE